ncbi:unnamed protein product [Discosporangium mesarthrocarpum]
MHGMAFHHFPNLVSRRVIARAASGMTTTTVDSGYLCCVLYISEGKDKSVLDAIVSKVKSTEGATLVRDFRDPVYHRTGLTIAGGPSCVETAAIEASRFAIGAIDLSRHKATHPRVGSVDHISVHSIGGLPESTAKESGLKIARTLGDEGLPVILYGELKSGRRLAEIRRSLPYFSGDPLPQTIEADMGPNEVSPSQGIATIGCTPLVINYNLLLSTKDKRLAAAVTRSVREKDGGLPWVEALTLSREDGRYEAACNLLRPEQSTPEMVLAAAQAEAESLGISVVDDYSTGLTEAQVIASMVKGGLV